MAQTSLLTMLPLVVVQRFSLSPPKCNVEPQWALAAVPLLCPNIDFRLLCVGLYQGSMSRQEEDQHRPHHHHYHHHHHHHHHHHQQEQELLDDSELPDLDENLRLDDLELIHEHSQNDEQGDGIEEDDDNSGGDGDPFYDLLHLAAPAKQKVLERGRGRRGGRGRRQGQDDIRLSFDSQSPQHFRASADPDNLHGNIRAHPYFFDATIVSKSIHVFGRA